MNRLLYIFCMFIGLASTHQLNAQAFLSIENDRRFIRHKAYLGDEIKYKSRNHSRPQTGRIDSLATDGYIRIDRIPLHTDSLLKVYHKHAFRKPQPLRTLLGGALVAGSAMYLAGNEVNSWITGTVANRGPISTPLIVMGSGLLLMHKWKRAYTLGRRWQASVLEL